MEVVWGFGSLDFESFTGLRSFWSTYLWRAKTGNFWVNLFPWRVQCQKIHPHTCFWTCIPSKNSFQTSRTKNLLFFSLILVFVVHNQYCLWRLKSEDFCAIFFYRYTLAESNISKCQSKCVFLNVHPWEEPFQTSRTKNLLIFLWFWCLLSTTSIVYEGLGSWTLGAQNNCFWPLCKDFMGSVFLQLLGASLKKALLGAFKRF